VTEETYFPRNLLQKPQANLIFTTINQQEMIKMLTDSILKKEAKYRTGNGKLEDLFGVWADDPETDHMEENIRKERTSNRTRKIVSFDECNGD
jgi:hypothetical protein